MTGDSNVGGLIGFTDPCSLFASNLFWNTDTSGRTTSAAGQGKTNAQMLDMSTFTNAGWDFAGELKNGPDDDWVMPPLGGPYPGYPVMWYQLNPWPETPGFAAGSGTKEDPYEISTELELRSIGENPRLMDKYYILTADITLADTNFPIIGSMGYPFIGGFDGQGHTITNLRYKAFRDKQAGMFGYVGPDYLAVSSSQPRVEIKNIRLISPRIETTWSFGAGALVGMANSGTQIVNCHADDANISGYEYIGGLVGHITFGNIQRSSAKGYVSCRDWDSGGLVGYSLRTNIEDCYSNGHVSNDDSAAGGLIGANSSGSTVTRCYSSAVVSGPQNTGGLVGSSSSSSCVYRTSFCDATVNPGMQPIGNATDGNVLALPTDQMYMQSTYTNAGWDFVDETANGPNDIWKIDEGHDYPQFAWEMYCAASAPGDCYEHISSVQVGSINNATECSTGGYADYTSLSTSMEKGTGYPIIVTNGDPYEGDKCGIWVDWNQDLDFDDAGEAISVSDDPAEGNYWATITPPASAVPGNTRMRVRMVYGRNSIALRRIRVGRNRGLYDKRSSNDPAAAACHKLGNRSDARRRRDVEPV